MLNSKKKLILISIIIIILLIIYYFANPLSSKFLPFCPFHKITGLDCPGCGNQRALHAILHGDFKKAIQYNAFLVIAIPYIFLVLIATFDYNWSKKLRKVTNHHITIIIFFILVVIWWIFRNIHLK